MNILVPLDFGKAGENAKDFAADLGKVTQDTIVFLHAMPPMFNFASLEEESWMHLMKNAKKILTRYVKGLKSIGVKSIHPAKYIFQ